MKIEINIPDGKSGVWEVETFTVSEHGAGFANMIAMTKPGGRTIQPGIYKKLTRNGETIMSNTPAEITDHYPFIRRAQLLGGNILINGLGLGVALKAILESNKVQKITVIEESEDVINLVGRHYNDPRVEIIHADAFEWKPPKNVKYEAVWHDIWDNICADNLKEMTRLHRKYGKRTNWQGSWCKGLCQRYAGR